MSQVRLLLDIDHKAGGFADSASMLKCIANCLNCNVNHVEVSNVVEAGVPCVLVHAYQGEAHAIYDVEHDYNVDVVVFDEDLDKDVPERFRHLAEHMGIPVAPSDATEKP